MCKVCWFGVQLWSVETSQQLRFHDDDDALFIYCCHMLPSDDRLLTVAPSTDRGLYRLFLHFTVVLHVNISLSFISTCYKRKTLEISCQM